MQDTACVGLGVWGTCVSEEAGGGEAVVSKCLGQPECVCVFVCVSVFLCLCQQCQRLFVCLRVSFCSFEVPLPPRVTRSDVMLSVLRLV